MKSERFGRRDLFRLGFLRSRDSLKKTAIEGLKKKFPRPAMRPPGALSEELFLLHCTRCGDCASACPYGAIQIMTEATGAYRGTPFIDPFHQACRYCSDMPCISSCGPQALRAQEGEDIKLGVARVREEHCLLEQGQMCDYCFSACPKGVSGIFKNSEGLPEIDEEACVGCGQCAYICVSQTGKAIVMEPS